MADKWQDKDLGLMIRLLNPYSPDMKQPTEDMPAEGAAAPATQPAPEAPSAALDLSKFHVEIDNYEGAWDFKGSTHRITRALRITYRYPVKDGKGVLATEQLLIGYAGGGGGA
jgi:hypothetical protein